MISTPSPRKYEEVDTHKRERTARTAGQVQDGKKGCFDIDEQAQQCC